MNNLKKPGDSLSSRAQRSCKDHFFRLAGTSIQRPGLISQMSYWRLRLCQSHCASLAPPTSLAVCGNMVVKVRLLETEFDTHTHTYTHTHLFDRFRLLIWVPGWDIHLDRIFHFPQGPQTLPEVQIVVHGNSLWQESRKSQSMGKTIGSFSKNSRAYEPKPVALFIQCIFATRMCVCVCECEFKKKYIYIYIQL